MADTMCYGNNHWKCDTCRRKTDNPNSWDSYYIKPPMQSDGICDAYWQDTDWQDPKRDLAIAQNGNTGAHYDVN